MTWDDPCANAVSSRSETTRPLAASGVRRGWTQLQAHTNRLELELTASLGCLEVCVGLWRLTSRSERPAAVHDPSCSSTPQRRVWSASVRTPFSDSLEMTERVRLPSGGCGVVAAGREVVITLKQGLPVQVALLTNSNRDSK